MKYVLERKEEEVQVDGSEQDNEEVRSKRISFLTMPRSHASNISFHVLLKPERFMLVCILTTFDVGL